jgi:serine/threonine protein kinase
MNLFNNRGPIMAEFIGRKLGGRYEVLEWVGAGGMAEVYKARHVQLDRFVAVKVMHRFLTKDDQFKTRFEREARLVGQLRHPHIVQVYDFDSLDDERLYYMVMEFIHGLSLHDYLIQLERQGQHLSLEQLLRFSRNLVSALSYAHAQGVIHRDIKPANVMLDLDQAERVVLTDFGLAKITQGTVGALTASHALVGTPAFIAPEHVTGQTSDARSDLYSFGVMMYQMATGRLPFFADTPIGLAMCHVNDFPEPPHVINPELPVQVSEIIMRCLAKDPAGRYQTANLLLADLSSLENMTLILGEIPDLPTPVLPDFARPVPAAGLVPAHHDTQKFSDIDPGPDSTAAAELAIVPVPERAIETSGRRSLIKRAGIVGVLLALLGSGSLAVAGGWARSGDPVTIAAVSPTSAAVVVRQPTDTPTGTPSVTASATSSATASATPSPTASPTDTASPSPTSTATETPTVESSPVATQEVADQTVPDVCKVKSASSGSVNVRSGPSTAYRVISMLKTDDEALAVGVWRSSSKAPAWWKVSYEGQAGWVVSNLVTTTGGCDAIPSVQAPPLPPTSSAQNSTSNNTANTSNGTTGSGGGSNGQNSTTGSSGGILPPIVPTIVAPITSGGGSSGGSGGGGLPHLP